MVEESHSPYPQNVDPLKYVMDTENFISAEFYELTNQIREVKHNADTNKIEETYYQASEISVPLCNIDGGNRVVHKLHLFYNNIAQMGTIRENQASALAGRITRQIFGNMLSDTDAFCITDLPAFIDEALTVQDNLEIFFSGLTKGDNYKEWSKAILSVRISSGNTTQTENEPKKPSLLQRIRGTPQQ